MFEQGKLRLAGCVILQKYLSINKQIKGLLLQGGPANESSRCVCKASCIKAPIQQMKCLSGLCVRCPGGVGDGGFVPGVGDRAGTGGLGRAEMWVTASRGGKGICWHALVHEELFCWAHCFPHPGLQRCNGGCGLGIWTAWAVA